MNNRRFIRKWIGLGLLVSALVVYAVSLLVGSARSDVGAAAREVGRRVEQRMLLLDSYIQKALQGNPDQWPELGDLPEDMVVYRYLGDSLQSWVNQFPLRNDDIRPLTLVQRIGDSRSSLSSPLADASPQPSFVNYGPKWYLVKAVEGPSSKVIAGLEIVDELREKSLNRHFRTNEKYSVKPLSASVGAPVSVNGVPLFLLADETLAQPSGTHSALLWLAVGLLMAGLLFLLNAYPTLPCLLMVLACQGGVLTWLYVDGSRLFQDSQLFSPLLYADGPFFYSLGAVILVNLAISLTVWDLYLVRWTLLKQIRRRNSRILEAILMGLLVLMVMGVAVYLHIAFRSILVNSSINLELYKVFLLTGYTALVYVSFLGLSITLPVLLQMLSPFARTLLGIRYDMFTGWSRVGYAAASAMTCSPVGAAWGMPPPSAFILPSSPPSWDLTRSSGASTSGPPGWPWTGT